MSNETIRELIWNCLFFILGIAIGVQVVEDKNCTITITDMRGVQHVIKGVADE